jgi:Spy/CpxP family protein refolding chaperone
MMRRFVLVSMSLTLLMAAAPCQAQVSEPPPHSYRYHNYRGDRDEVKVLDQLNLSEEQEKQFIPMLSTFFQAKKTARANYERDFENLLTTEQKPQYELLRQEHAKRKAMLSELKLSGDQLQQEKEAHERQEQTVRAARETLLSQSKQMLTDEQQQHLVDAVKR